MPRRPVTFKFSEEDEVLLEAVRRHSLAASAADAVRIALREYADAHDLLPGVRDALEASRKANEQQEKAAAEHRERVNRELKELVDQASKP